MIYKNRRIVIVFNDLLIVRNESLKMKGPSNLDVDFMQCLCTFSLGPYQKTHLSKYKSTLRHNYKHFNTNRTFN